MGQYLYHAQFELLQSQAENIIAQFQRRFGFPNSPPVPIEMIAQALFGLQWESRKLGRLGKRTVGALSKDSKIIYVDERCNRHQYVFAVAHEMGHWVLHEGNHCSPLHFDNAQSIPLSRILGSARAKTKKKKGKLREIEANRFAAALLMPCSFLFSETAKYEVIDAKAVGELAREFDVSLKAMLYRIKNLYKHLAWSGPRIDWDSLHRLEGLLTERWQSEKQATHGSVDQVGQRFRSAGKSEVTKAIDSLMQFACRQPLGEFPSLQAQGPTEVHTRKPFDHDLVLSTVGKKVLTKVIGDYRRKPGKNHTIKGDGRRPFIIELAGTPNAGKDSLIKIIKDYLEDRHGYRVRVFDEGVKFSHVDKWLYDIDRLYKTVALAVIQLYEASFENPGDYDFVIFNRGLFDRLAFLHAMGICGRISQEQEQVHVNYLLSYADLQDITFLFLISPEESIQRETERGFVNKLFSKNNKGSEDKLHEQRIFNMEMLAQLNSSYLYMYHTYKESFNNQICLFDFTDGSDASIFEKACALADATLPGHSAQLPFPELFGVYYARRNSPDNRNSVRRQCLSKSSAQLPTQLSFSWE